MELTKEQHEIINSTGNIKINAVAGSGKTTTIIEYAKSRPKNSKILYLAFNKSVKLEAKRKFHCQGLGNVHVETAHSLAYRHIVQGSNYKVRQHGYKTHELADLLGLQGNGDKHAEFVVANHINKFASYFCNSDKSKVQDLNYIDVVSDKKAKAFVNKFYKYIEKQTRLFLAMMDKGDVGIIHDFYLKKFQLSNPVLNYDYILFDEGQDASPAMLDVFIKQKATKVIVGDTHQQIYGWRFAVNSLEKTAFKAFSLSVSFRFGQDIAKLAMEILKWKKHLGNETQVSIKGKGKPCKPESKAVLARTNLGLLLKAIELVNEKENVDKIYFEGNINSYTYANEGASLYDVLNLYNGKRWLIKDKLIKEMKDMDELEEYIEKTEDKELSMLVNIVKEYGNKIFGIIKSIKEKHIDGDDKQKAEMVFSTVHRGKGMEYDSVQVANDFITENYLEKVIGNKKENRMDLSKLNEEINLLYVAVTRAKSRIYIPETLMPANLPPSPQITATIEPKEEEKAMMETEDSWLFEPDMGKTEKALMEPDGLRIVEPDMGKTEKAYTVHEVRVCHKDAYKPWTTELDEELTIMFCEGAKVKDMAEYFGRTQGAIRSRIKKLEMKELYG